jgi:uncharacterized caspase-like protein
MKSVVLAFLILLAVLAPAQADDAKALKGVALVIGQSKYQHIAGLANPANDAKAIGDLLGELGFEVTSVSDRDAKKLRRDLDRFTEDADGADVAVVYYSGHGIEAGGENWLVPVDADPATPEDMGKSLVPLSDALDELKATVPVTIFLIDACRSNPFPPGTLVKREGASLSVSAGGLGVPRGFAPVQASGDASLGTVIGYAAEPGQPAIDGEAGSNSPYAAAILRHLSALQGEEFGLVMRMVTEEVYLKTKTRQRPWVNESLRKELYFGAPPIEMKGEEGIITGERRKLLLTISDLPDPERRQVEQVASAKGVPLDTLYGVLAALGGTDIPKDPQALGTALAAQAEKIKAMLAEQNALSTDDPDLKRLSDAADAALADGAIKSARAFLDEAKALVEKSRSSIEDVEAKLKAKRIANAAILAKSAEAAELDFDFYAAARDYNEAFDWVKKDDQLLAAKYLTRQADALQSHGEQKGDMDALRMAVKLYGLVYRDVPPPGQRQQWAKLQNNLANTYLRIGERAGGTAELGKAVSLYRVALAEGFGADEPSGMAITNSNLGTALHTLAQRTNDMALYDQAKQAFAVALASRDRKADPLGFAEDLLGAANLGTDLAARDSDTSGLDTAVAQIEEALKLIDRASAPMIWAEAKINLGVAYRLQGAARRDPARVEAAIQAYRDALSFFDRARFPMDWGSANGNLAIALTNQGAMTGDMAKFEESLPFFRLSFEEVTRERAPEFWARTENSYGMALQVLSVMKGDPAMMDEAANAFRDALSVRSRELNAMQWAESQSLLASAVSAMASARSDSKLADEAIAAYRATLEVYGREKFPSQWMQAASGLAMALQGKGITLHSDVPLKEAETIYQDVLAATPRGKAPLDWASAMKNVATIQFMLGTTHMNKAEVEQSIASFDKALEEYNKSGSFMDKMMIGNMRNSAAEALKLFK